MAHLKKIIKLIVLFIVFVVFIFMIIINQIETDPQMDCLEFGFCKKGLFLKMDSDVPEEITKESCLKHNGEWRDNKELCYFLPKKF